MSGASADARGIKELLDELFANAVDKNRATVEQFIEMERLLLEQYQKYLAEELATSDDLLQKFTKLMMSSWIQIVGFHRDNRSRVLELHSSIAEAHLRLLEMIEEQLSRQSRAAAGVSPDVD
jgi:hypothetical protein